MTNINQPQTALDANGKRLSWSLFIYFGVVFFFAQHDMAYSKSGIDNYNLPTDSFVLVPPLVSAAAP